jgi:hypothetical protein
MARASDPVDRFARFPAQSEHSPLAIKNYRLDLDAFAAWFEVANGEPMEPARITPTDLRQIKPRLVDQRRLQPSSAAHKLTTLTSFLTPDRRGGHRPRSCGPGPGPVPERFTPASGRPGGR